MSVIPQPAPRVGDRSEGLVTLIITTDSPLTTEGHPQHSVVHCPGQTPGGQ